ncbi:RagB/SusD family nutrient uptake outer membrane protein [Myroides odoratus]|uniref:SusD family n=1 Tax=Myroides odoratus TaxID=256 RepID=A0A378RKN7_MYROD|nr:RagB/SusD family nutrient uptake outer membrane protein [Myroides odoratus]QQU02173.1 RagB/SusD family nutrient uptake outer membrane protein [Myroides odoratus]STZ26919.1 SusD family [Myroides odoratus]
MKKIIYILCLYFIYTSCENFTEIDSPVTVIPSQEVFNDYQTAQASLAHIYSKLFSDVLVTGSTSGIGILMGAYSDELTYYNTSSPSVSFYNNQVTPTDFTLTSLWDKSYNLIYATNSIITGVKNSNKLNTEQKKILLGEAYFLRAYIHYFILELFGKAPYITSTDFTINSKVSKLTEDLYLSQLEDDLQISYNYLDNVPLTPLRTKPSYLSCQSLLAKVNLLKGNWSQAIKFCNDIINSSDLKIENNLDIVFLKESQETIWQLSNPTNGGNTLEATSYIFISTPPPLFSLNEKLIESFELNDLRKEKWIGTLSNNTNTYAYSYKYKQNKNTANSLEHSIQLRLAEIYLIRAESYIQSNQIELGIQDINTIRNRANLTAIQTNNTIDAMTFLEQEKRHELFCEQGHRFFDLKRWNKLDSALKSKSSWYSHFKNLPLPEKELLLNPNLNPQNNGY